MSSLEELMLDLSVQIGGVTFKNPVFVASGTFGYGIELKDHFPVNELGAIVTKGLTLEPLSGNPPPRLCETPCGLLNSIGLENVGIDAFLKDKLPLLKDLGVSIVVNIAGSTPQEYRELAKILEGEEAVCSIELNVSCPNVKKGGMEFGRDPVALEELVFGVREVTKKPLWVKLTPNFVDVLEEARAAEKGGADALTAINTLLGMSVDVGNRKFRLATGSGGLSGPAIHPVALYIVHQLAKNLSIPIIASGGASDLNSFLDFILVGAYAVQVGTASFLNPRAALEIREDLLLYMEREGIDSLDEIRGAMLKEG